MPVDFIPLTNKLTPTKDDPTPLEDRYLRLKSLDKRLDLNLRGQQLSGIDQAKFKTRLSALRNATVKWGSARTEAYFVEEMNKQFPDLTINGRKLESSADFVEIIKKGTWDNDLRAKVAFASFEMWGDNNQFAINFEIEYCNIIRIKWTGLKCNGKPPVKIHKGKCCAALFVKNKGTLVGKIRNACKRRWCEAVYSRSENPKVAPASAPDMKDGIPKLLAQITATVETLGFNGKLGICAGSKRDVPESVVARPEFSPMSPMTATSVNECSESTAEKGPGNAMDDVLEKYKGRFQNTEELLAHLLADQAMKEKIILTPPSSKKRTAEDELVSKN